MIKHFWLMRNVYINYKKKKITKYKYAMFCCFNCKLLTG